MIIHLISSPRTVSTSLMYAFDNRPDTVGIDEPYYAYYLEQTGKNHPGRDIVLDEMPANIEDIWMQIGDRNKEAKHVFVKNMGHHIFDRPPEEFADLLNVFLIRNPKRIVRSIFKVLPHPELLDIAVERQWFFFQELNELGESPIVIDSSDILAQPKKYLQKLCERLDLPFSKRMLHWEPGPRSIDGSWAPMWYGNTHRMSGFVPYKEQYVRLETEHEMILYEQALPYYQRLRAHALVI